MESLSGISTMILLNAFLQIVLSNSRLVYDLLGGKRGGKVLYTLSTAGSAGVECRSTLFPVCRSIFIVVGRYTLFPFCRSISTSSSDSSLSLSRLIVAFPIFLVLDCSFSREGFDLGSGSSRSIGRDLLSPVFSASAGFSAEVISTVLGVRRFPLLSKTTLTWRLGLVSVLPGRRYVSLLMAVAFSAIWPSSLLMCSLRASNFLISSL